MYDLAIERFCGLNEASIYRNPLGGAVTDSSPTTDPPNGAQESLLGEEDMTNRKEVYKLAFEESIRALEDQRDELSGLRQRVVQFLAFTGSATAFLLGSSFDLLKKTPRDGLFYPLVSVGSVAAAISITCVVLLLRPRSTNIGITSSSLVIIASHIESVDAPTSEGRLLRELGYFNGKSAEANDVVLTRMRLVYMLSIGCGALQLLSWTTLVWQRV